MKTPKLRVHDYSGPYHTTDALADYGTLITTLSAELDEAIAENAKALMLLSQDMVALQRQLSAIRTAFLFAGIGLSVSTVAMWVWVLTH
jgi:hypothetical protein